MPECIFCKNLPKVMENELAYVLFDINPVSRGHALIIPKRHFEQIFDASREESAAIKELMMRMKARIDAENKPAGYNIWMNCGQAAGQVVMHAHVHLIPRYAGEAIQIKDHLKGNIE
ncbi:MAG: HIT domain-containing protein [Candidatus Omnitrophica bacterium]|nr:HIT domain-containing protein [Candidatus Omnitrophota bacterium]